MRIRKTFRSTVCVALLTASLGAISDFGAGKAFAADYTVDNSQVTGGSRYTTFEDLRQSVVLANGDTITLLNDDNTLTQAILLNANATFWGKGTVESVSGAFLNLSANKTLTIRAIEGEMFSFKNFSAATGGMINGGSGSKIILGSVDSTGTLKFSNNSASHDFGGAIYGASIELAGGSNLFEENFSNSGGGAIYGTNVLLSGGSNTFTDNYVNSLYGGAIQGTTSVELSGGTNTFTGNKSVALSYGGAIRGGTNVKLSGGENIFTKNASGSGGAIYGVNVTLSGDNTKNTFTGNMVGSEGTAGYGGAIRGTTITFSGGTNTFTNNYVVASGSGGALHTTNLWFSGGTNRFTGNESRLGGAITASKATFTSGNNTFTGNKATTGGVISIGNGADYFVSITGGTNVFSGNTATISGGVIAVGNDGSKVLIFGGSNEFSGNIAALSGGAIYSGSGTSMVSLSGGTNTFKDNKATSGNGGAIYASTTVKIEGGTNTFSGNTAVSGGVISGGSEVLFSGGENRFTGNGASSFGGAIYSPGNVTISGNTVFQGNYAGKEGGAISINAVNVATLTLNATGGDIVFSGNLSNAVVNGSIVTGTASAVSMRNTQLMLTGAGNIFFNDPISVHKEGNAQYGNNRLEKTGSGFVQFSGQNVLNQTGMTGGSVSVKSGAFRVVRGAGFSTAGNENAETGTPGSVFTVENDAMLAGGGSIAAEKGFVVSGIISPDAAVFTESSQSITNAERMASLTLSGAVTLKSTAKLSIDILDVNSYDFIKVLNGNVALEGAELELNLLDLAQINANDRFHIVQTDSAVSGLFSNESIVFEESGLDFRINYGNDGVWLIAVPMAVPEPSSYTLALSCGILCVSLIRRRRR